MSTLNSEALNFGNLLAAMLEHTHCPTVIRAAINSHLMEVYQQADLTRPDIIRVLYAMVAPAPAAPAQETSAAVEAAPAEKPALEASEESAVEIVEAVPAAEDTPSEAAPAETPLEAAFDESPAPDSQSEMVAPANVEEFAMAVEYGVNGAAQHEEIQPQV
jgi:hypothetical protein